MIKQTFCVGGGRPYRSNLGIEPGPALGRVRGMGGEFVVVYGESDVDQSGLVGHVHRKERHDGHPLFLPQSAEPLVGGGGVTVCHFLQREQPGGMTTDAGGALAEHRPGNLPGLPTQGSVTDVHGDASERNDPRCVQDADDLRRHVDGQLLFEGGGSIGQTPHLQELPATSGLEDAEGPALPVTLRRSNRFSRHLQ